MLLKSYVNGSRRKTAPDPRVVTGISLIAQGLRSSSRRHIESVMDALFLGDLNEILAQTLLDITNYLPELRTSVQGMPTFPF